MNSHSYIDKYFEGTLTTEEQQEFDRLCLTDNEFAESLAYQKQLKKAITLSKRTDLKKKLQGFEVETKKPKSFKVWIAAASILLLCTLGYYFSMTSNSGLYDDYYQTYPNVELPTVRGNSNTDLKSQAFYAYDQGNYQQASEKFSEIYNNTKDDYALFYKAVSQMELHKHEEAIADLNAINLDDNPTYTPFITWYKALCYLKLDNEKEAKPLLKSLAATDNPQKEMAAKLLSELE